MGNWFSSSEPNHVPGPSTADREREQRVREALAQADRERQQREREAQEQAHAQAAQAQAQAALARAKELQRQLKEIEEINRQKEEDKKNYPLPDYLKDALMSGKVNIAVTGNSGVGKSSFINFMRGLKSSDAGFAKTGIAECTMKPTPYEFKPSDSSDKDTIWDLPGAGTDKFPQETYMKVMGIRYFDVVLLLTAERFTQAEVMLKQEMDEKRVPYFCVRTRADIAWDSKVNQEEEEKEDQLTDERKQELKDEAIKETKDYFKKEYGIAPIYPIASVAKYKKAFEFDKLKADLERAIKNARCDQHCPTCWEKYEDYGGTGHKMKVGECGHTVCEECFGRIQSQTCQICRQPWVSAKRARVGA